MRTSTFTAKLDWRSLRADRNAGRVTTRRCAAGQTYGAQAASFVAPHYGQVGYLSEGVVGTAAALSAVLDRQGWTVNAVVVGIAGMG